ncbi:MAG: YgiT-type zinc finger domain-containing protein [bacterium]|nr:MAG: YgiT-type zinc finger domain-containing protein [bacterium]
MLMYGYKCEYCDGIVKPKTLEREVFKHKKGFVILENVVIGVCNSCANRYYSSDILHTVNQVANGSLLAQKTETIPVLHL